MTNFRKNIGETLRVIRKQKGLTQDKVAEFANIDSKHYSRIERGVSGTRVNTLIEICSALEISIIEFFDFYLNLVKK